LVSEKRIEAQRARAAHEEETSKMATRVRRLEEEIKSIRERKNSRIQDLESRIASLKTEREEKAKQYAEVSKVSRLLMSITSGSTANAITISNTPAREDSRLETILTSSQRVLEDMRLDEDITIEDTPVRKIVQKRDSKGHQRGQDQEFDTKSSFGSNSSSKSGSTPKRTKVKDAPKTPNMRQSRIDSATGVKTVKTAHGNPTVREPFKELDGVGGNSRNNSPLPSGARDSVSPGVQIHLHNDKHRGHENLLEVPVENETDRHHPSSEATESSFGGSGLFSSTQTKKLDALQFDNLLQEREREEALQRDGDVNIYDETTVDFD
jgi:hypothetical protein